MHNFCWPLTVLPRGTLQHEHLEEWNNSLEGYAAAVAVAEQVDQPAPISLLHCFISSPSCPPRTGRLFPLRPIADKSASDRRSAQPTRSQPCCTGPTAPPAGRSAGGCPTGLGRLGRHRPHGPGRPATAPPEGCR